jgi:hypothetical protein
VKWKRFNLRRPRTGLSLASQDSEPGATRGAGLPSTGVDWCGIGVTRNGKHAETLGDLACKKWREPAHLGLRCLVLQTTEPDSANSVTSGWSVSCQQPLTLSIKLILHFRTKKKPVRTAVFRVTPIAHQSGVFPAFRPCKSFGCNTRRPEHDVLLIEAGYSPLSYLTSQVSPRAAASEIHAEIAVEACTGEGSPRQRA